MISSEVQTFVTGFAIQVEVEASWPAVFVGFFGMSKWNSLDISKDVSRELQPHTHRKNIE